MSAAPVVTPPAALGQVAVVAEDVARDCCRNPVDRGRRSSSTDDTTPVQGNVVQLPTYDVR